MIINPKHQDKKNIKPNVNQIIKNQDMIFIKPSQLEYSDGIECNIIFTIFESTYNPNSIPITRETIKLNIFVIFLFF